MSLGPRPLGPAGRDLSGFPDSAHHLILPDPLPARRSFSRRCRPSYVHQRAGRFSRGGRRRDGLRSQLFPTAGMLRSVSEKVLMTSRRLEPLPVRLCLNSGFEFERAVSLRQRCKTVSPVTILRRLQGICRAANSRYMVLLFPNRRNVSCQAREAGPAGRPRFVATTTWTLVAPRAAEWPARRLSPGGPIPVPLPSPFAGAALAAVGSRPLARRRGAGTTCVYRRGPFARLGPRLWGAGRPFDPLPCPATSAYPPDVPPRTPLVPAPPELPHGKHGGGWENRPLQFTRCAVLARRTCVGPPRRTP